MSHARGVRSHKQEIRHQDRIVNLPMDLRNECGLRSLFVVHDLSAVGVTWD